jgi:hypothetical protein
MTVWNKTGSSTWTKINSIFNKTGSSSWTEIISVWVKTASNAWTKVFARVSVPANTVPPAISGSTKLYGTLSGTIGTWTAPNGTNSYARQWQSASNTNGVEGIFGSSQTPGETSSTYTTTDAVDGRWVRLRVTATNLSGDAIAFSDSVLITKYAPVALTIPVISGAPAVNSTLTAQTTVGTYWKNTTTNNGDTSPTTFSYRWYWGDTGDNIGSNSPTYIVQPADINHTIRVDVTAKNTGGETMSTSAQTATVGQQIGISNVTFTDSNGNNGFNNRGNLVTATSTRLSWKVSGVNSSTTFRVRYRVLNNQTGAYWSPDSESATTASAAWLVYESNYNNVGGISNVTISGGDAFVYDIFSIPEIFNGSTYDGGISRWTWEYEISAVIGGTRYYWSPGDTVSTSFSFDWWDIDPTSLGTITATPTSGGPGTSVTFSGIIQSYPSGLNTYPYAYRVVYGDGNNSGWIYPSYGTNKPTYSLSNTYNSTGNYTAYVETIPNYSFNTASVSIQNVLTAPSIYNVTAGDSSGQPVSVYFTGGSGPFYQMYWTTGVAPTFAVTPDASGSSNPLTDNTGPTSPSTAWYAYVRSVASVGETSVGPSALASAWSAGYQFTVTQAPIIPTISGLNATSIGTTSATISWSSTNQSSYSISGGPTFLTGTTSKSVVLSGLSSSTFYNITVTVTSSTGNSAQASVGFNTASSFVTPSISLSTNPPAFARSGSTFNWGWNNAFWSGSTSGNPSYPWRIRSGSSSGTIIASGTRSYTTGTRNVGGTQYNYRIGTTDGDTPTTTSGRWGSYQATILGTNGQTYSSGFSASV